VHLLKRFSLIMTEKHGKILKVTGVSGIMMLLLGLLIAFKPETLLLN